jgi:putative ABC transport system permease protein
MIKHYFTIIYRNLIRAKGYFAINLIGLTAGLACSLFIFLWAHDEWSINKFHEKDDRLFQVLENQKYSDGILTTTSTPGLLAEAFKAEMPEVEFAATTTWVNSSTLSIGDLNIKAEGFYVSSDFFNVFTFPLLQGTPGQVLNDKLAIVISKSLAEKLFGTSDGAVGKTLDIQHETTFMVSGVFADVPAQSSLKFDFVVNLEEFKERNSWLSNWTNNGPPTYIVLKQGVDAMEFEEKIKDFLKTKNPKTFITLLIQKYSDRYLYGKFENGLQAGGRIEYVRLFLVIAVFIVVIACINFMNLSTARASKKAKEVGIKKSVGAQRASLMGQFLSESVATSFVAVILAISIVWILLPAFNMLTDKLILFPIAKPAFLLLLLLIGLLTGLLAGSYPALYLSGFRPAAVLKGEAKGSFGELWVRKGLVVFQFLLSVILIVSVIVVYRQTEFLQRRNLGYNKDNLIRFNVEGKIADSRETFLNELRKVQGVIRASSASHTFTYPNNSTQDVQWEGKLPDQRIKFETIGANYDLMETLEMEMTEGRFFSEKIGSDSNKVIFNQTAINMMGLSEPIGKVIKLWSQYDLEIIGVVKDFHFRSLHESVEPLLIRLNPANTWMIMARLDGNNMPATLKRIENLYKEFNPGFSFEYSFQDDEYAKLYAAERRVATLALCFATLAILISCLGLFGLAAFTAERRRKEIGIRKALGASSQTIVLLLSNDFSRLVIASIILGLPISYWLLNNWLARFAYRIDLGVGYFILAGSMALLIAWITVASQALRASRVNPVDCLREQ